LLGWSVAASHCTGAVSNVFDRQFYGPVSSPDSVPVLPGRSASSTATFRE
jgi:hypothetical protein